MPACVSTICSVRYRCKFYTTTLVKEGNTLFYTDHAWYVVLDVSSGPGRFTITSVTIGEDHDLINVTFGQVSHVIAFDNFYT